MKAVSREGRVLLAAYRSNVQDRVAEVEAAIVEYERVTKEAHDALCATLRSYNDAVADHNEAIDSEIADLDEFTSSKGDRWRAEHEEDYARWRQALEEGKATEADLPEVPTVEIEFGMPDEAPPLSLREME